MGLTIRRNTVQLDRVQLVTREDMAAVGQLIRQRILDRTARGVDAEGRPFAAYAKGYARTKREALGTVGVDLTVSGEMLRAITIEATDKSVRLGFAR